MSQIQHTIIFDEEITKKNVQNLINTVNSYNYVNLYFSTAGGRLDMMEILIDFLNHRNSLQSLKLILFDLVSSAGTLLLTGYDGPIFVKDLRGFLFHAPDIQMPVIRKDEFQRGAEKLLHTYNNQYYDNLLKLGLTKSELKRIKDGDDIYVFPEDFHRLKVDLIVSEEQITSYQVISK